MITEFSDKYQMLPREGVVLCALSGGADSMCLLHVLLDLSKEYGYSVACAHFNHCLRGEESQRDARFVEEHCAALKVPFYHGSGDVNKYAAENKMGIEEAARSLRYSFLQETADKIGALRIATAHNANDNAETILLNLTRGTGLLGLAGIPPVRENIIRPLLKTTRAEIEQYLQENAIPHVEDSTNAEDDYSRNKLRHKVLPVLAEINSNFILNASRAADSIREDEEFLNGLAKEFIKENLKQNSIGSTLPVDKFMELPEPVSARVLKLIVGGQLSAVHIQGLKKLFQTKKPSASIDIPGMQVMREYDIMIFSPTKWENIKTRALSEETVSIPEAGLLIKSKFSDNFSEVHNSVNTFFFKYATISGSLIVRSRLPGDKIRIIGRNCTKSVKKLFSDAKLSQRERDLTPIIADDTGVLAVYGFGIDERIAAMPGERAIKIEFIQIGEEALDA